MELPSEDKIISAVAKLTDTVTELDPDVQGIALLLFREIINRAEDEIFGEPLVEEDLGTMPQA